MFVKKKNNSLFCGSIFSKSGFYQNAYQSMFNFSNKYSQETAGAEKLMMVLTCWWGLFLVYHKGCWYNSQNNWHVSCRLKRAQPCCSPRSSLVSANKNIPGTTTVCDGIRRVSEEETVYLIITLIITLRLIPENLFSLSALTGTGLCSRNSRMQMWV